LPKLTKLKVRKLSELVKEIKSKEIESKVKIPKLEKQRDESKKAHGKVTKKIDKAIT